MNINILSYARNEEQTIQAWIRGVKSQTLRPKKIVVVNDGSTDKTTHILNELKKPFEVVTFERKKGDHSHDIGRVLYEASKHLDNDCDYVAILETDTLIEHRYYEKLIAKLNDRCGFAGGIIVNEKAPTKNLWGLGLHHIYGSNRVYTMKCWHKLNNGKLLKIQQYGWDTYHHIHAIRLGFKPRLCFNCKTWNLRPRPNNGQQKLQAGMASYRSGYYWPFLIVRAYREKSPIMIAGFLKAHFAGGAQWDTQKFVREKQITRLKRSILSTEELISRIIDGFENLENPVYS